MLCNFHDPRRGVIDLFYFRDNLNNIGLIWERQHKSNTSDCLSKIKSNKNLPKILLSLLLMSKEKKGKNLYNTFT